MRSATVIIRSPVRAQKAARWGTRAMVPSSFMTSQITPAGVSPASRARSTAASVCPARSRTPPRRAFSGKTWPGCTRSCRSDAGSIAILMVRARSAAEIPVVTPWRASIDTVNAVSKADSFLAAMSSRPTSSHTTTIRPARMSPMASSTVAKGEAPRVSISRARSIRPPMRPAMPPVAAAIVECLSTIGQVTVLDGRVGKAASDRRRQSILDAALERFTTVGYGPTTVAEIRQRARVTTGSLYHYFPRGKADVAAAVHLDCLRRYQDPFLPCLDAAGGDAESGVRGAVRYHLEWIAANPWRARFLFSERPAEVRDGLRGGLAALNRDFFARVGEWLDRHVAAGALRPLPAQALYALWIGPAQQVGRQLLDGDLRGPLDDAIDILGDGAWRALRREQAGGT